MSISFGPFLAGFLAILFLTLYVYVILNYTRRTILGGTRWIFLCISVLMIRNYYHILGILYMLDFVA